jgi:rubredoxin
MSEAEIDKVYHPIPKDNAWRHCTIAGAIERGRRLWIFCERCGRHVYVDAAKFVERHGIDPQIAFLALSRRMRCTKCKTRLVRVREEPFSITHDRPR